MKPVKLAIINAAIWTGTATEADAIAVTGGRIACVGFTREILSQCSANTQIIDAGGKLVLPGFIDNHTHFLLGGRQLLNIDLRRAGNEQEFTSAIAAKAASLPPGLWLTGGNWDHEQWSPARLPQKGLIDRYTTNTPVFITRLDLHMGLANSLALKLAGIDATTVDPPGGKIVHDANGEPTGILKDAAMDLAKRVIPKLSEADNFLALSEALGHAATLGITSIQDISSWEDWSTYHAYHHQEKLTCRVYARTPIEEWDRQREWLQSHGPGDKWLRLGGNKGFIDGSLGSTTALFFEPYDDVPDTNGLLMHPLDQLSTLIGAADKAGLQVSVHAIGDKANHLLLDIFTAVAAQNGPRDRRFRIEHAQHLRQDDIRRLAACGVIASVQPYHAADDGRWAERRLGYERCKTAYPFRSLLDAGTTLSFGTDWTVAPLNPLLGIHAAVTRQTIDGRHPDGWHPKQRISIAEAVHAYTEASAYAEFSEKEKGSIAPGMLADIVILSQNIFQIPPAAIPETEILYTICDGKVIYQK